MEMLTPETLQAMQNLIFLLIGLTVIETVRQLDKVDSETPE